MMIINVGQTHRVTSDIDQYIVQRKTANAESWSNYGYYTGLDSIIKRLNKEGAPPFDTAGIQEIADGAGYMISHVKDSLATVNVPRDKKTGRFPDVLSKNMFEIAIGENWKVRSKVLHCVMQDEMKYECLVKNEKGNWRIVFYFCDISHVVWGMYVRLTRAMESAGLDAYRQDKKRLDRQFEVFLSDIERWWDNVSTLLELEGSVSS